MPYEQKGNEEKCPECNDQGIYLDYVKKVLQDDILIFVFDRENGGSPVELIAQSYNISSNNLPGIIIQEESYGFISSDEIFDVLCEKNKNLSVCIGENR